MQRLSAAFPVGPHAGRNRARVIDFAGRTVGTIAAQHRFLGHWWSSTYTFAPNAYGASTGLVAATAHGQTHLWERALRKM